VYNNKVHKQALNKLINDITHWAYDTDDKV